MMIFLVIVSIASNMIAFLLIAILFLRQNKLIKMEESLKQPVKEMEVLMTTYLLQMKEENEQFIKSVKGLKKDKNDLQSTTVKFSPIKLEHVEEKSLQSEQLDSPENFTSLIGKTIGNQAVKAYQRQNQHTEKEIERVTSEKSETNPEPLISSNNQIDGDLVLHLQKQGCSLETIAKKLNRGKTEIELYLTFHEKRKE
jgi:DNA-nicking Smr family endonuclease